MTEAEKALVDFVLSKHWSDGVPEGVALDALAYAVGAERVTPEAKRAWMDAFKARERAMRTYHKVTEALNLPDGVDYDEWRTEARKELASE